MPASAFFAESPESVGVDPVRLEALFERAEREVREGLLPSCQIALARAGKIAGMRSFGQVSQQGRPAAATDETLYVMFSATKGITSAAAWLLIQEGKLSVDERVADVIPEFGTHGKQEIRIEQLFTHTAGFPHAPYPPAEWHDRERRLERFSRWRLNWEPGSRFEYHPTSSMWVIAELIEQRSGVPYREFVRQRIAEPLGLDDLWVGLPREQHARLADILHVGQELTPQELEQLGLPPAPETEVTEEALQAFNRPELREAGVPGGGGVATAADLALFYQALLGALRPEAGEPTWHADTIEDACRVRNPELTEPLLGKRVNRGLGIIVAGDADRNFRGFGHTGSERMFGHGGAGGQIAWCDPESGISLAYLTNGIDRHAIRQARRGVGISSRAADCALG
ncbi:MAG: serine hydrolase domain-containing protein [Myxococcota bacterium]|nr:serine hydrolase domain-containing protein [Myxococcota bacterium]